MRNENEKSFLVGSDCTREKDKLTGFYYDVRRNA